MEQFKSQNIIDMLSRTNYLLSCPSECLTKRLPGTEHQNMIILAIYQTWQQRLLVYTKFLMYSFYVRLQ